MKFVYHFILVLTFSTFSVAQNEKYIGDCTSNHEHLSITDNHSNLCAPLSSDKTEVFLNSSREKKRIESGVDDVSVVYICTGAYSYAYHSRSNCVGLNNCKGQINYTDEYSASSLYERVPCCRCWSNVQSRCHDDNKGASMYGGGGDEDVYAYLAIFAIAASVAIVSNDFYVYPTYSFLNDNNYQYSKTDNSTILKKSGYTLGFRKTFDRSALEYGASILTKSHDGFLIGSSRKRWGFHLNYVQNIFTAKTHPRINLYAGTTFNYIDGNSDVWGYGGIIGAKYIISDRLIFDSRYELSSYSNQLQFGLIINYQQKYLWE
jgi:hypothetical protein